MMTLLALAGVILVPAPAQGDIPDDPRALATRAEEANPSISSIERQITALRYMAEGAVLWSDPVFSIEYSNIPWDTWSLGDSPMSGLQFQLRQSLTLPGKNERRVATVEGEGEVKRWEREERKNQLRAMVRKAYWNLSLVRLLREITRHHIKLVDQLLHSVMAKYQVGMAEQHDMLNLEVVKRKLIDELGDFKERERAITVALNAVLRRDISTFVTTPKVIPLVEPDMTLERLFELAREHSPLLKGIMAQGRWRRLAAQQAAYERWPDLAVWAGYRIRQAAGDDPGTDFISLGLSLPLPIDYTGRSRTLEEQHLASAEAADESYQASLDEIRSDLAGSLASWRRAVDKTKAYRESLIPLAELTLRATLAAYQTDMADFALLYQAELQLLQLEKALRAAEATTQIERSTIETMIGVEMDVQER